MFSNIPTHYKESLDSWCNALPPTNAEPQPATPIDVPALIKSLADRQLLTAGWNESADQDNIQQRLYLHYRLAQQPFGALGLSVASHIEIGCRLLRKYGSQAMQAEWVSAAQAGEKYLALAMTESSGGSDLLAIQTSAQPTEDGWNLSGEKTCITNAPFADAVIVLAKTNPARTPFSLSLFLVPTNTKGVSVHPAYASMGHESVLGGFTFEEVSLPKSALLGQVGAGLVTLMQHLDFERLVIASRMTGLGEYLLEQSVQFAQSRETFGQPLIANQTVQFQIAEFTAKWLAVQSQLKLLTQQVESNERCSRQTAMLKLSASQLLQQTADFFLQLSGGQGYMAGSIAERAFREAPALSLAGGSDEVMKSLIAKQYVEGAAV